MTDGDLVKVAIEDDKIVSIILVSSRVKATHVVSDSWRYKDFSALGVSLEAVEVSESFGVEYK